MKYFSFFYKSSPDYLKTISPGLEKEIYETLETLPERNHRKENHDDLFWLLFSKGWAFSSSHSINGNNPPEDLGLSLNNPLESNDPKICRVSTVLEIDSESGFSKKFGKNLVHSNIQENSLKEISADVTKFRIAFREKRIQTGIEMVFMNNKTDDTKDSFENVKDLLFKLDIDCPIWLLGVY